MAQRSLQDRFTGTPAEAIAAAKQDIISLIDETGRLGPKFVRLGFHDCVGESMLCFGFTKFIQPLTLHSSESFAIIIVL